MVAVPPMCAITTSGTASATQKSRRWTPARSNPYDFASPPHQKLLLTTSHLSPGTKRVHPLFCSSVSKFQDVDPSLAAACCVGQPSSPLAHPISVSVSPTLDPDFFFFLPQPIPAMEPSHTRNLGAAAFIVVPSHSRGSWERSARSEGAAGRVLAIPDAAAHIHAY